MRPRLGVLVVAAILTAMMNVRAQNPRAQEPQRSDSVADSGHPSGATHKQENTQSLFAKAFAGDVNAQLQVAEDYENGIGVPQNRTEAISWYMKAAESGSVKADLQLGDLYQNANPPDYHDAAKWIWEAAVLGDAGAENQIGLFLIMGQGVPQDYPAAAAWFMKSAKQGNGSGEENIAICYELGQGVQQDYSEAYFWMNLATMGDSGPMWQLESRYRDEFAAKLTKSQIAEVQKKIRLWLKAHPPRSSVK